MPACLCACVRALSLTSLYSTPPIVILSLIPFFLLPCFIFFKPPFYLIFLCCKFQLRMHRAVAFSIWLKSKMKIIFNLCEMLLIACKNKNPKWWHKNDLLNLLDEWTKPRSSSTFTLRLEGGTFPRDGTMDCLSKAIEDAVLWLKLHTFDAIILFKKHPLLLILLWLRFLCVFSLSCCCRFA